MLKSLERAMVVPETSFLSVSDDLKRNLLHIASKNAAMKKPQVNIYPTCKGITSFIRSHFLPVLMQEGTETG